MNEFIVSTKGSLWECSCPECQNKGERQGSRKGLKYNWDGVPFEEIEFRLDSPVIDEDIYSMSDEELLQFAEDHGLRPEMFTNELPDWAQRDGSRKGSRKGRTLMSANGWFDVSDIDKLIAEGNIPNKGEWGLQGYIEDYLKSKRYSSKEANLTWDAWARFEDLRYGIPEGKYEEVINRHRKIVGLPPM